MHFNSSALRITDLFLAGGSSVPRSNIAVFIMHSESLCVVYSILEETHIYIQRAAELRTRHRAYELTFLFFVVGVLEAWTRRLGDQTDCVRGWIGRLGGRTRRFQPGRQFIHRGVRLFTRGCIFQVLGSWGCIFRGARLLGLHFPGYRLLGLHFPRFSALGVASSRF